jgi:peptide/nickel transport system substrate-binding protein
MSEFPLRPVTVIDGEGETSLRYAVIENVDSLNPFVGWNDISYVFWCLVYDSLISLDEDMKPKPNLALSWNIVPDELPVGSVWQYNLTRNAKWHDGEPFTAEDVVFTFEYQIGFNWSHMWAFQPYTLLVDYVEALDEYTVRIHFQDLDGNPAACSAGDSEYLYMVPKHIWQGISSMEAAFSYTNPWPIGTGPFMCTANTYDEYLAGDHLILLRNPDYHGTLDYGQEVKFDRLILDFYTEPTAIVSDIERGAIDVAAINAPNYANFMDWLNANPTDDIGTYAGLSCTGYSIDIAVCMIENFGVGTNNIRLDPAVRHAMAHATNKQFIRDHIYRGYADIGSTVLSPVFPYWYWAPSPSQDYEYDLSKASEILETAGYRDLNGDGIREATEASLSVKEQWAHPGTPLNFGVVVEAELYEDRDTVLYLKDEWKKIGIEINPIVVNLALWAQLVDSGSYDLEMTYWSGDPDPNYLLYIQSSYAIGGWSENRYSSEEYDENYTKQVLSLDPEERREYVYNCQELAYRDAAYIVTVYPYNCFAWREDHFTGWGNWSAHPGRAINHFWSANDLFFDLVPTGATRTNTLAAGLFILVVAGVVVVAAFLLPRRKRGSEDEETILRQ